MVSVTEPCFPIDLVRRIRQEYLETPGLSLTFAQARRLFGAEPATCAVALAALMESGLLSRDGERYVRINAGNASLAAAMRSRAAPYDCRWAEPVLIAPAPLWLDTFCGRWTCLKDGGPRALDARDCLACPRWEPRLATRRRDQERRRQPDENVIQG